MRLFILKNIFVDDFPKRREEWREQHFAYLQAAIDREELMLAGHIAKSDHDPFGDGYLIFQVDNQAVVEQFARNDPYAVNGLVKSWSVMPWNAIVHPEHWSRSYIDI